MFKTLKRIVAAAAAAATLGMCAVTSFAKTADEEKNLLVIGDSITTGYGLEGYVSGDNTSAKGSFANRLSKEFSGYENYAVDGRRSGELYDAVKGELSKNVKKADTVVISIGGNDLLIPLIEKVMEVAKNDKTIMKSLLLKGDLTEAFSDVYDKYEDAIKETMESVDFRKVSNNIAKTLSYIKKKNPDADVYILTVYNCFDDIPALSGLSDIAKVSIGDLNKVIKKNAEKYGANVIDVNKAFKGKSSKYTNITKGDIHPNKEGHKYIYKLLYKKMGF